MNTIYNPIEKMVRRNVILSHRKEERFSFYYEDNTVVSSLFVILSAMFPPGEMFFIESIRNVRHQISDKQLCKDIQTFIAQEAFHSREHQSLNKHLLDSQFSEVLEIEAQTKRVLDQFRKLNKIDQLAATVVMEHFTATLAQLLLTDGLIQQKTTQEKRDLREWHALEELEHKSVAYDVLTAVGGNTPRNRSIALLRITKHLTPVLFGHWYKILKRKDIKFSLRDLNDCFYLGFGGVNRLGILTQAALGMFEVTQYDFNPRNMQTEQLEAEYRKKLFGDNGSLAQHLKT